LQVDDDLWTELRRRGRERVLQMYTQEGVARATFEAYRKALNSPASSVLVAP
jgi:glycosyltransferase involved in cell wall biosynthesis